MVKSSLIKLLTLATVLSTGCDCAVPTRPATEQDYFRFKHHVKKELSVDQLVETSLCLRFNTTYEDEKGNKLYGRSMGTGLAYREADDGYYYVLTNSHLSGQAEVKDAQGTVFKKKSSFASIVDSIADYNFLDDIILETVFESTELDIAVLRTTEKLKTLDEDYIGDSDTLKYGDEVYLAGYPEGLFPIVTKGIIANPGKYPVHYLVEDEKNGLAVPISSRKVIDITLNAGNSGSPFYVKRGDKINWMGIARGYFLSDVAGKPVNSGLAFGTESNVIRQIADYVIMNAAEFIRERSGK